MRSCQRQPAGGATDSAVDRWERFLTLSTVGILALPTLPTLLVVLPWITGFT